MKIALTSALALAALFTSAAFATTPNYNFGSLGSAADGVNDDAFTLSLASPLAAPGDFSGTYGNNVNTVIPYQAALNPAAINNFTIEFWAMPFSSDNDDVPLSNRTHTGNRSGWAFFQRAAGWNFRMYNGVMGNVGLELTGGTSTINLWSHVVVVWNSVAPRLYVNGVDTNAAVTGGGGYNVNLPGVPMAIGAHDSAPGSQSPYEGLVDEVAFYDRALDASDIFDHYNAAFNPTPGAYDAVINQDLPLAHYTNVPEPASASMLLLGLATLAHRRRRVS